MILFAICSIIWVRFYHHLKFYEKYPLQKIVLGTLTLKVNVSKGLDRKRFWTIFHWLGKLLDNASFVTFKNKDREALVIHLFTNMTNALKWFLAMLKSKLMTSFQFNIFVDSIVLETEQVYENCLMSTLAHWEIVFCSKKHRNSLLIVIFLHFFRFWPNFCYLLIFVHFISILLL